MSASNLPYFQTGEESDSDGEEEEDDAEDRAAAFSQNKRMANRHSEMKESGNTSSIGRYDELGDYIARSERVRVEKPVTEEEERKRKVRFRKATHNFLTVHEIPAMTDDEKKKCFMGPADWENIDKDVEVTKMRWRNHKAGKIKFDYEKNTLRGLEVVFNSQAKIARLQIHSNTVLEEAHRQKTSREYPNWEKLGSVAAESSKGDSAHALKVGEKDLEAATAAWNPKPEQEGDSKFVKKEKKKKKGGGFFGMFKKKK